MIDDDRRYLEWRGRIERARAANASTPQAYRAPAEVARAYERRLARSFMDTVRTASRRLSARHRFGAE
jgi:hypothetical protein